MSSKDNKVELNELDGNRETFDLYSGGGMFGGSFISNEVTHDGGSNSYHNDIYSTWTET